MSLCFYYFCRLALPEYFYLFPISICILFLFVSDVPVVFKVIRDQNNLLISYLTFNNVMQQTKVQIKNLLFHYHSNKTGD